MNELLEMLRGGDLRSDGRANEVADKVLEQPILYDDLFEGLWEPDEVVRARTAHALERISRYKPQMVANCMPQLVAKSRRDEVPMVKWHLAMILANLVVLDDQTDLIWTTLTELLEDPSVYVHCWSISGLTVFGKAYPSRCQQIVTLLKPHREDPSKAVSNRASKAVAALNNEDAPVPKGWLKGMNR